MKRTRVYKVIFKNGVPTLPESVHQMLLHRGITEEQIQVSFDILSREMIKKALKSNEKSRV